MNTKSVAPASEDDTKFLTKQRKAIMDLDRSNLLNMVADLTAKTVPSGIDFYDKTQYQTLTGVRDFLAAYNYTVDSLEDTFLDYNKYAEVKPGAEGERIQQKLIQTYALYVATSVGLSEMELIKDVDSRLNIKLADYKKIPLSFDKLGDEMNDQIILIYRNAFNKTEEDGSKHIKSGDDLAKFTKGYFEAIKDLTIFEKDDGLYKKYLDIIEKAPFSLNGMTFKGFQSTNEIKSLDITNLPKLEYVIAMDDVKKAGIKMINNVMHYDFEEKKNAKDPFVQVLYVPGPSGCGKTFTAEALMRYAIELGKKYNKPVNAFILTPDMFKSSYQNETANKLNDIFQNKLYNENSINIMYIADFDTIVTSRKQAEAANRIEDVGTAGVWLSNLSGSKRPQKGFWCMIADTNYQVNDDAMLNRLGKPVIGVGAKTSEEFQALMKVSLRDGFKANKNYIKVEDKEWKELGDLCSEYEEKYDLSGRDIRNIGEALMDYANDFEMPEEVMGMKYKEQLDYILSKQTYKDITKEHIVAELDDYVQNRKAAKDREREEEKEKMIKEWRLVHEARGEYAKENEEMRKENFLEEMRHFMPEEMHAAVYQIVMGKEYLNKNN